MIDAYEIGIQLMLQDDVSAGLAVINRGLAEVDRAIAATSANLTGLIHDAETATKGVAIAASGRTASVAKTDPKPEASPEQIARGEPKEELPSRPATKSTEKAAAPGTTALQPAALAIPTARQSNDGQVGVAPDLHESAVSSTAPVGSAVSETVVSSPYLNAKQIEPNITVGVALPTAPTLSEMLPAPAQDSASGGLQSRGSVTPRATPVALSASVSREHRPATVVRQSEPARPPSISGPVARRERPVAPWSGVDQSGKQVETMRLNEKAASPQPAGRNQTESTGGAVMLEGRLVGQWLSEHMGREASRPPGGTSFFDARQTPAWNVSGAL